MITYLIVFHAIVEHGENGVDHLSIVMHCAGVSMQFIGPKSSIVGQPLSDGLLSHYISQCTATSITP